MKWLVALALAGCGNTATHPSTGDAGAWSFSETFAGNDGAPWPTRWRPLGGVASSTLQSGRGRLVPVGSMYSLARMGTSEGAQDVDVSFQLTFEDVTTQGVGFYVRQNGGWLQGTTPHGQGYAVFVEGFRGSRIGAWREVDGTEVEIQPFTAFSTPLASNVLYAVHFRVKQTSPTSTQLQTRVWEAAQSEPTAWQVDASDTTASLQNISGGMAIDSYSSAGPGQITTGTLVGNIAATRAQ